jgi:ADP-dependent NAD(P)H-hydrate dehydratase / NAD(P)H-hydrate epimerase
MAAMIELLTPEECYRADEFAKRQGIPLETLINNAGRAVAEEIVRRYGARKTVVLCGPGNNGKDGQIAARCLKSWGWPVHVAHDVEDAELVIDALYGAGLSRDFPKEIADRVNSAGVPVVSIDMPSGLDGLTGLPRGTCIKADLTMTFFRKKPAHVLLPGRSLCGEIVVADIGIPESVVPTIGARLWENAKPRLPRPTAAQHKYAKGHAVVMSGDKFHTGASRLSAQAALKIGAGLVTLAGDEAALDIHAANVTAVMLAKANTAEQFALLLGDPRKNAICIGPAAGIGPATIANVRVAMASYAAIVLDADALTSFARNPAELFKLIQQNPDRAVVLTPHEGEFGRIFSITSASKIERAREAARQSGAILLLKGADTVIAAPDGRAVVNTNAPQNLATAGSGDVLAGIITGLLAQGVPAFEAACAAAWLHGEAAKQGPQRGLTAETLIQNLSFDE